MSEDALARAKCIIVMGVSGCGKSTVGEKLANQLHCEFKDGDTLHPMSNVEKMSQGIPLNDSDRHPWLNKVKQYAEDHIQNTNEQVVIVACSSLKKSYRDLLRDTKMHVYFLFLKGSKSVLEDRMKRRQGHFMKIEMLYSQLDTLESPEGEKDVMTVDVDQDPEDVMKDCVRALRQESILVSTDKQEHTREVNLP